MIEVSPAVLARRIGDRIGTIRDRMSAACRRAGRPPEAVTLVGVTKTFPIEIVEAAYAAGLRDFGENRIQELIEKAVALPGSLGGGDIRWHMIGHIQRNKARDVVATADVVHAVDSERLADALHRRADEAGRTLPSLVQVNVSGEHSKFGLNPDEVLSFIERLRAYERLDVLGLMTLAAPTETPESVRPQFRLLRTLLESINETTAFADSPLTHLSMGMSGDFEVAIEEGATHVRIGSALFGDRERV